MTVPGGTSLTTTALAPMVTPLTRTSGPSTIDDNVFDRTVGLLGDTDKRAGQPIRVPIADSDDAQDGQIADTRLDLFAETKLDKSKGGVDPVRTNGSAPVKKLWVGKPIG